MGKIDEKKEYIGLLKSYINVIVAFILAIGAGVSKMYLSNDINILFWFGISIIFLSAILFILIARKTHNEIKKLRDIKD